MASVFKQFRATPFYEIDGSETIYNKIKELLVDFGAGKAAAMQVCVVCGARPDNYDLPLLGKCVLGHNHKGCCMGLRDLLCSEEEGGLPASVKAQIARTVMKKGAHEALYVQWLELAKLVSRKQWTWSRPTIDQLREWFPAPVQAAPPQAPPASLGILVGVVPPPQVLPAHGQPLPPLRDLLGGCGSAMPSAMPSATSSLADALSEAGGGEDPSETWQESQGDDFDDDQEDMVDPSLSASQCDIQVKKEYTTEELMANNFQMCFELLGVAPSATIGEIKRGYYLQALRVHPDKHGGSEEEGAARFRLLSLAYKLAFELRERADFGTSARRMRQVVDLGLLTFVPLSAGESERTFTQGGTFTNCDISTAGAVPLLFKGDQLSPRACTIVIGLNQKLADHVAGEGLHRLGFQYYLDGNTSYVTEHSTKGDWLGGMAETFAAAIDSPDRGLRMGKPLGEQELRDLFDVADRTNPIYDMLKFFLSPMDADNWWVSASERVLTNQQWWSRMVKSPVHSALCWLIGGAPLILPESAPVDEEHPLMPYYDFYNRHCSGMLFHNSGDWSTKKLVGGPTSRAVLNTKKQIEDYWAAEDHAHTVCVLTEGATDLYNTLMSDADPESPAEYNKRKAEAYLQAMEEQEPAAKKQRAVALTPTTQGSSSAADDALHDGSSADCAMLLD